MYNATSTDDGHGEIETYEAWLERQLLSRIERLEEIVGAGKPWPLNDVLKRLIDAGEILLHKKGYDGTDHEEIFGCVQRAKEIINTFERRKQ